MSRNPAACAPFPRQTFPDRCDVHADEPTPPPCGKCADVRKANATRPVLSLVPTRKCWVHMEDDIDNCRGCAADRKAATA